MNDLLHSLQSGTASLWLFIPTAVFLGALHGLEPGHSKTMMTAFIIAIRGTLWQAILLGLSAAISHSLLIWVLAALALHYGNQWNAEAVEPYLQLVSAVMIFGLALWMYLRTRSEVRDARAHQHGHAHDEQDHHHAHHDDGGSMQAPVAGDAIQLSAGFLSPERLASMARKQKQAPPPGMMLDTGHGWLRIEIHEDGVPPRFRIHPCRADGSALPLPRGTKIALETARLDGSTQRFQFEPGEGFWESTAIVPEPHEFAATLTLGHEDHAHTYRLRFVESHSHEHGHEHRHATAVEEIIPENAVFQDAHERAHAEDIARRFTNRTVTTPQIVLFGITGGLMPCPAAFTVLLVCLQLKKEVLGFSIVGAFSFGLALTMVTVGATAAWSVRHAEKRFKGFGNAMRKAPYVSCVLLAVLAAFMAWSGWHRLHS